MGGFSCSYVNGEFLMKFSIGTPALETYAVPDTGSGLVWFQCKNCNNCYKQKQPLFDPTQSTAYKSLQCCDPDCKKALGDNMTEKCKDLAQTCTYRYGYVDTTYSEGVISEDVYTFDNDRPEFSNYTIKDAIFGCGLSNSQGVIGCGGYDDPGIVGLSSEPRSLVSQLTLGQPKQFPYCIAKPDEMTEDGTIQMQFGGAASVSGHSTALAPNKFGFYFFRDIEGLYCNDERVNVPDWLFQYTDEGIGGIMMDTGTSHTFFRNEILSNLIEVLKRQIQASDYIDYSDSGYPLCYLEEDWEGVNVPDIELRFKNSTTKYLCTIENTWVFNNKGQFCLDFVREYEGRSILGVYQQRGIKFGYDLEAYTVSFTDTNNCTPLD